MYTWAGVAFLQSYMELTANAPFLPQDPLELQVLFDAFVLEKAILDLDYELKNRPDMVEIPLERLFDFLESSNGNY